MTQKSNEHSILIILLLYFLPIATWILYTYQKTPINFIWPVLIIGAMILFFGSALLLVLFRSRKEVIQSPVIIPAPIESPFDETSFLKDLEHLQTMLNQKSADYVVIKNEHENVYNENIALKAKLQALVDSTGTKEEGALQKIQALEIENQAKQNAILHLENQIHDLRYEIKTLLQLTEVNYPGSDPLKETPTDPVIMTPAPEKVTNEAEARRLLQRCLDISHKMTIGYRASNYRNLAHDPFAFDLRRLSDSLKLEKGAVIVYSPKDERILFAHQEIQNLFGISLEEFSEILTNSEWKKAVDSLMTQNEVSSTLKYQNVQAHALLGTISSGIFRSMIIAIIYSSEQ